MVELIDTVYTMKTVHKMELITVNVDLLFAMVTVVAKKASHAVLPDLAKQGAELRVQLLCKIKKPRFQPLAFFVVDADDLIKF